MDTARGFVILLLLSIERVISLSIWKYKISEFALFFNRLVKLRIELTRLLLLNYSKLHLLLLLRLLEVISLHLNHRIRLKEKLVSLVLLLVNSR